MNKSLLAILSLFFLPLSGMHIEEADYEQRMNLLCQAQKELDMKLLHEIQKGHPQLELIYDLIEAHANPDALDSTGKSIYQRALELKLPDNILQTLRLGRILTRIKQLPRDIQNMPLELIAQEEAGHIKAFEDIFKNRPPESLTLATIIDEITKHKLYSSGYPWDKAIAQEIQKRFNPDQINAYLKGTYPINAYGAVILIKAGADREAQNSALYAVLMANDSNSLKALLGAGVDPNYKDSQHDGSTALIRYIENAPHKDQEKSIKLIDELIKGGADISIKNDEHKTALDYAQERGLNAIVSFFLKR